MVKGIPKKGDGKRKLPEITNTALVPAVIKPKRAWASVVVPRGPENKTKPVTPESNEQREAFNRYLAMGDSRSMRRLAEECGKTYQTIGKWGARYDWVRRVIAHEAENADNLLIESHDVQQEKRKFGLQMIDKILRNTVTMNADGTIATCSVDAKSPSDIRTLLILRDELLNSERGSKTTFGKGSNIHAENAVFIIKK